MPRVVRYCAAAFAIDCAFYLTLTGVPYKAMKLGATPLTLGLLPAVWSVVYIAGATYWGRLSDRIPRITMARTGTVIVALAAGGIWLSWGLAGLFLALPLAAVGLSLYWPALQAALSEADRPDRLSGNLGLFNTSWSSGKATGFAIGGILLTTFGFAALFASTIVAALLVAVLLRPLPRYAATGEIPAPPTASRSPGPADGRRRRFLWIGWVANGAAYGAIATLTYHYPKLLSGMGLGAALFGAFLAIAYFTQTATFLFLMRVPSWHYRRWPIYLIQAVLGLVLLGLPELHHPATILPLAPLFGIGVGLAYYSSIYYSLHGAETPGRYTGIHEAIIGSGTLLIPLMGGAVASATGRLEAPYWLAGAVCLAAVGISELLYRGRG